MGVVALLIAGSSRQAAAATVEITSGDLAYSAAPGIANALVVSLASGTYTIDDPAESAVGLGAGALAAGCLVVDANTVTCPEHAVSSFHVSVVDMNDTVDLSTIIDPATITGGSGDDTLTGGLADDLFIWAPGSNNDFVDGKGGSDILYFGLAGVAEHVAVFAPGGPGFRVTRDIATVDLEVVSVEIIDVTMLGGDDTLDTVPLVGTMQFLGGGSQSAGDVLNFFGQGACFSQAPGTITGTGFGPVLFEDFEAVNVSGHCVPIFSDGFEDGTTDAWALTVP
jgi:hypothetical protein